MKESFISRENPDSTKLKAVESALEYASISMLGAWIGFLMWAPKPELIPGQLVDAAKSFIK